MSTEKTPGSRHGVTGAASKSLIISSTPLGSLLLVSIVPPSALRCLGSVVAAATLLVVSTTACLEDTWSIVSAASNSHCESECCWNEMGKELNGEGVWNDSCCDGLCDQPECRGQLGLRIDLTKEIMKWVVEMCLCREGPRPRQIRNLRSKENYAYTSKIWLCCSNARTRMRSCAGR
jgi:hypothetical protein